VLFCLCKKLIFFTKKTEKVFGGGFVGGFVVVVDEKRERGCRKKVEELRSLLP
jgi:glutamate synthase domain-containing protein 3